MPKPPQNDLLALQLELSCHQNFKVLFEKLHKIRKLSGGKTQTQDLVRTFMLGVNSFFPCASVRIYYGGWYYEHFENQRSLNLPPLSSDSENLVEFVMKGGESIFFQKEASHDTFQAELDLYFANDIQELRIYPIVDVNHETLGVVEFTIAQKTVSPYQQELVAMIIQHLSVLLEVGQKTLGKTPKNKRSPAPELLSRLKKYEDELEEAQQREKLFYSLIRYFRDTVKMVDAWRSLQSLTPENEIGQYDFSHHSDFYFRRAYKFSELLLYSYKIRFNEHPPQLMDSDIITLIHKSLSEFTRHHQKISLNVKTLFPVTPAEAMVDPSMFHIAILYALEHLFLQNSQQRDNNCLVIEVKKLAVSTKINLRIEKDPLIEQLHGHNFDFEEYMDAPLDEYGLGNLYLPFVKMAITNQGGMVVTDGEGLNLSKIEIEIPKEFLMDDTQNREEASVN